MKLEELPARAYLYPDLFVTGFDTLSEKSEQQYQAGLKQGDESLHISISVNSVWGAFTKNGGCVTSYEKIGYHAHTASLLRGFLNSGCTVIVHRVVNGEIKTYYLDTEKKDAFEIPVSTMKHQKWEAAIAAWVEEHKRQLVLM